MKNQTSNFVPFQTKLTPHDRKRLKEAMQTCASGKHAPTKNNETLVRAWVNGISNE